MLRSFAVALAILLMVVAAADVARAEAHHFDVRELRLANGLRVVTDRSHRVPLASVVVRYNVGSSMDPEGRTGLAELTMWLMSRRSQHVPEGEFTAALDRVGAIWQYNSSSDATIFQAEVPINAVELAFWLMSDPMGFFVPALQQSVIDDRIRTMKNERATIAARKGALANKLARDEFFPEKHPYRRQVVLPEENQLDGVTTNEVAAFAKRWFVPSNAILVVAGDVPHEQVVTLANKYFGTIDGPAAPPHVVPPPIKLSGETRIEVLAPVQMALVTMDWPTPPHFAPGDADLDVVAGILHGNRIARLSWELVTKRAVATSVDSRQRSRLLASMFEINATVAPGHNPQDVIAAIDDVLRELCASDPSADDMTGSLASILTHRVYALESNASRALLYADWLTKLGVADSLERDFGRYAQVTAASVRAAARDYLPLDRRLVTVVVPDANAPPAGVLSKRDVKPAP